MADATPKSVASVSENFETQIQELRAQAKKEAEEQRTGGQVQWSRPKLNEWDGNLFDWEGMEKPFDRMQSNQEFISATSHQDAPGTTGDLIATTTQVDYLSVMERAYRMRHTMRRPRAMAHSIGRRAGHGHDKGTFTQCGLEYLRGIILQSKGS